MNAPGEILRTPVRLSMHVLDRPYWGAYGCGSHLRILLGRRALQLAWGRDVLG